MQFQAIVLQAGKTATGIEVPSEVVTALGSSKHPAVNATINGYTYRSSVASMGGKFMLPISAEHRAASGVAAGDEVAVDLTLDTEPRTVNVPPDFAEALEQDAEAKQSFDKLSYSHKLRHIQAIEQAKTAETRQRRVTSALGLLRDGKATSAPK